ncbi:MAG: ABC transporter ATP-binding protein [Sphingobacteriales bacterium]|nr:MAG: ABC transporter ATP-binding protein [Sphingobacteriales bacterium]
MHQLIISNLTKTYPNGTRALGGISLSIQNGMFGLLGPNGAGKSTLMRTLAGLQAPDSGSILFDGTDVVSDPGFIRRQLGYLPQDFGVYSNISAARLLDHLAVLKGITGSNNRRSQINNLLERTNLTAHRNKAVSGFSGGMRQRFGIAQALLGDPAIIIVDEPTAGLDPEERNRFNNLLSELGEDIIVILSTHLVEDVNTVCSRMAIVHQGNLLAVGEPAGFIRELEGRIWTRAIDKHAGEVPDLQQNIISSRLISGRLNIHVVADGRPGEAFRPKTPTLEDVYFSQLHFSSSLKTTTNVC